MERLSSSGRIVCNNCGLSGHIYRDCRNPVMSYGHLLFDVHQEPKILMILRKDSLCYIEFLRGKYDVYNVSYIQTLIDKCSLEEKQRLLSHTYDELWVMLWNLTDFCEENMRFRSDYNRGKDKFSKLHQGYHSTKYNEDISLEILIGRSHTTYKTSEWEFPKGRRNNNETDKECASREFSEETGYTKDDYTLLLNVYPYSEEYMGENNVRYKHVYYLGYRNDPTKQPFLDKDNIHQISEVKDIKWLTYSECMDVIRDYHHTRIDIINKIFTFLSAFSKDYYIVSQYIQ